MPGPKIFPSILPDGQDVPDYEDFDWDQLRAFAGGLDGVDGKGSKEQLLKRLDEHYDETKGVESLNGDVSNDD